jgi:hypothetical protein
MLERFKHYYYQLPYIESMEREIIDLTNDTDRYVRPPDQPRRERLIPSAWEIEQSLRDSISYEMPAPIHIDAHESENRNMASLSEDELEKVLFESKMDYDNAMEKYCKEIYEAEQKVRQARFMNVRRVIERICRIDKANAREYNMLLDAFTMYENGYFEQFIVRDEILYTRIMFILKSLRITKGEYDDLVRFIVA